MTLAAMTPSAMRALMVAAVVFDQLSPIAEAPKLVSTRIVLPVSVCTY